MKKTLKKFNISDIVIVIGLLAVVCGILFRNPIEKLCSELFYQKDVKYVVSVSAEDAMRIDEGAEITSVTGESLGTVKLVKPDAASRNENNAFTLYNVTIETPGMTDKLGTYIGDSQFIAPRMSFEFYCGTSELIECIVKKVESDS